MQSEKGAALAQVREQLLQEPAVLEGAPSLTTDHRGATAGAQFCCHSLAQVCFKQT